MTIQQKLAERIYELLPHKKELEPIESNNEFTTCKVIYEPIRLADVLIAIKHIDSTEFYFIDPHHFEIAIGDLFETQKEYYNLSKDNILDQSDEFCEFIYKLLSE